MLALLLAAAQIANPGFERELAGWGSEGHSGLQADVTANPGYGTRRAARGRHWLIIGWRARNAAPRGAERRVFTQVDARRFRGRTIRVSVQTRAPDFADRNASLIVRAAGAEAQASITASEGWRRHAAALRVPREARWIEIALLARGTSAQLDADDFRLDVLRRR